MPKFSVQEFSLHVQNLASWSDSVFSKSWTCPFPVQSINGDLLSLGTRKPVSQIPGEFSQRVCGGGGGCLGDHQVGKDRVNQEDKKLKDNRDLRILFRATPTAFGSSPARRQIRAVASSHSHTDTQPQPQPHSHTAIATQDPSCTCDLHHSSWQRRILNPLSKARDGTRVLMDTSWVRYR